MEKELALKIVPGISFRRLNVIFYILKESQDHVNQDRGSHR